MLGLERFDIPHSMGSAALAERFIAGAHEKGAGTFMLDLEDSIPMEQKQAARATLPAAVPSLRQRGLDVWIRLNNRPEHL